MKDIDRKLVIAGNNCYATFNRGTGEPRLRNVDVAMLAPFINAWPGREVQVWTTDTKASAPRSDALNAGSARQLLPRFLAQGPQRILSMPFALARLVVGLRRGDVAYARLPSPTGAALVFASIIRRVPLICSLHGHPRWSRTDDSWQGKLRLKWMYRLISSLALNHSELFFTTATEIAQTYRIPIRKCVTFSNTLMRELPPFTPRKPAVENSIRLLYIGRFSPEKNPQFLFDVASELAGRNLDTEIHFVGDGELHGHLRHLRDNPSLERISAHFHGWIEDRDSLFSVIKESTFLLLPSTTEGSPKVMIEAMACSTPVVTWAINDRVREFADNGDSAILAEDLDARVWADLMIEYLESTDRNQIIENAYTVASSHTVDKLERRLAQVFARWIATKG